MSHHDSGCIDEVVQVATTQSNNLNGTGFTEKFNNDSNPVTSSPILIPTSESSVPPPRSTFKSIVLVLTVTFSMIVNVGCLSAVPVPPTHTFAQKTNKSYTANISTSTIALPTIQRELDLKEAQAQWIVSAYSLSSVCNTTNLMPNLSDKILGLLLARL